MFLGFHYSLAKLPDEPMRPRVLDDRIGYFWTDRLDYTTDTPRVPIVRYVNRSTTSFMKVRSFLSPRVSLSARNAMAR